MALLKDILYNVSLKSVSGNMETEVSAIAFDSRKVNDGTVFVAVSGTQVDGHQFIDGAIKSGAVAIVCEKLPKALRADIAYVEVQSTEEALGIMASNFYDNPSKKLKLIGITGTNGKTTCVTLLFNLFRALGYNTGMLSTVENKINEKVLKATHTTPDAITINELLAEMVKSGVTHCFMESSSHAIVQRRIAGLVYDGAVFTNITHEHLDYHKTFDEYIRAKKLLFDGLPADAFALVNADDKRGAVMLQNTKADKNKFGIKSLADFKGKILSNTIQGLELDINHQSVWFKLIGDFNAYNLLAVLGTAVLLGEDEQEVLTALSNINAAPGRFDLINTDTGVIALVDYAHTPDALENVLKTIDNFRTGNEKVITVVGCGGNRDATKRPLMAKIACEFSDKVVLTSDNPRFEEPLSIINDMQEGVSVTNMRKTLVIEDRKEAIKTAASLAEQKDIILVAGKGHEDYQEINGERFPFDDKKVLSEMLNLIHKQN